MTFKCLFPHQKYYMDDQKDKLGTWIIINQEKKMSVCISFFGDCGKLLWAQDDIHSSSYSLIPTTILETLEGTFNPFQSPRMTEPRKVVLCTQSEGVTIQCKRLQQHVHMIIILQNKTLKFCQAFDFGLVLEKM